MHVPQQVLPPLDAAPGDDDDGVDGVGGGKGGGVPRKRGGGVARTIALSYVSEGGASTLFGAGGVSVYGEGIEGGGGEGGNALHPALAAAAPSRAQIIFWDVEGDRAALLAFGAAAPRLLPTLFEAYPRAVSTLGGAAVAAAAALLTAVTAIASVALSCASSFAT